jgi:hypothetical protein
MHDANGRTLQRPQLDEDCPAGRNSPPHAAARSLRFFERIDAQLPRLPDNRSRHIFLDRQIAGWERRYSRFLASEGTSDAAAHCNDPPQATDFLLTIAGLAKRRSMHASSTTGATTMYDSDRRRRFDRAMLSLLVAADQRCPAIIGQAHLLYHGAMMPPNTCEALARLKQDTEHLLAAIAKVEAELPREVT